VDHRHSFDLNVSLHMFFFTVFKKMKIRLRQLKNKNGTVSLRLDTFMGYYTDAFGKRKAKRIRETLPFHIPTEDSINYEEEKIHLLKKANQIRSEKESQLLEDGNYPFSSTQTKKAFFVPYLEALVAVKISNKKNNESVWIGMQRWYKHFASPIIQFKSINEKHCASFYHFLQNEAKKSNGTFLANSTIRLYYQKFYAIVQQAYLDGMVKDLPNQPASFKTENIKYKTVLKQYEVVALRSASFVNKDVKNAFLMSVEMGIKLGQLRTLKWRDIQHEREEWYIKMPEKTNTKAFFYPIPENIKQLLGNPLQDETTVFPLLRSSSEANVQLLKWGIKAGIARHITFESARNTFAYNKVINNTSVEKIQLYLGHQNLRTTEKFIQQLQIELPKGLVSKLQTPTKEQRFVRQVKNVLSPQIKAQLTAYSYQF
jgi:integrase/recombinase XerD